MADNNFRRSLNNNSMTTICNNITIATTEFDNESNQMEGNCGDDMNEFHISNVSDDEESERDSLYDDPLRAVEHIFASFRDDYVHQFHSLSSPPKISITRHIDQSDEEFPETEEGILSKDIDAVVSMVGCSRNTAIAALRVHGDVVSAVLSFE